MKYSAVALTWIILAALTIGTSPVPPYHTYELTGTLVDTTLEARDSLYVLIFSKTYTEEYKSITGTEYGDHALGRTNASGDFYVRATSREWADSVCLAFFGPDLKMVFSEPMGIPDSLTTKIYSSESVVKDQDEFLWFTCNTQYETPLVGYEHRWSGINIDITTSEPSGQRSTIPTGLVWK